MKRIPKRIPLSISAIFLLLGGLVLGGCAARITRVNPHLFKNPTEFERKVGNLKRGMSKEKFLETLGINDPAIKVKNLELLGPVELWLYVYGQAQILLRPGELRQAKETLIAPYDALRLSYAMINKVVGPLLAPGIKVKFDGYDLRVVAVFENNNLWRAVIEGTSKINKEEEIFVWDILADRGLAGAGEQAAKQGVKAVF